jgi:hypothetical protein
MRSSAKRLILFAKMIGYGKVKLLVDATPSKILQWLVAQFSCRANLRCNGSLKSITKLEICKGKICKLKKKASVTQRKTLTVTGGYVTKLWKMKSS